ncbi:IclR family transcriptional regulator, pca regulon regulatory protein [Ketogulonicigenium robustum]|uniref:IclR family transcriptional regulator, pca regulon regulatory protein n=1 Tax=Ketogulonicigenium robustum TaxID=92947 RepID=A0A1W6P130_9RHOB|nr:IclR family transcriptional regulator C-terminal domain-containing protein [Ketogulonicigenium robustum]ARO15030.1 IclR family transcriptional regulator, pca regulon regulatory protein [Ketogulonicigenium robustum]
MSALDENRAMFDEDKEISLTFARGLDLIEAFAGGERRLSIPELAARTDMNRTVVRRLVRTLEKKGYAKADRGVYELTPHILRLIRGFIEGRSLPQIVHPLLRAAAEDIGESVSFAMLDDTEAVYVAHAFLPARFTLNMVTVGSRAPLLPTAVGRVILAFLPDVERASTLARLPSQAHTPQTETDDAKLAQILADCRRLGYCLSDGEYVDGVASLAVPVFDGMRRVTGALSIIFPTNGHDAVEIAGRLAPRMQATASALGSALQ